MHFYKKSGAVHLSLKGDLVLSRNEKTVTYGTKSALPHSIAGGYRIAFHSVRSRIVATGHALAFIWGHHDK